MTIMKKHILALAGLLAGAMMATSCSQARLDEVEHLGVTEVDKTYAEAERYDGPTADRERIRHGQVPDDGRLGRTLHCNHLGQDGRVLARAVRARTDGTNITVCRP